MEYNKEMAELFRLQKYKKFESNSQQARNFKIRLTSCFDCKSTKNLRAIHNCCCLNSPQSCVVSTAKVQKIWEQFTTYAGHQFNQGRVVSTAKVQKIWEQFTTCALRFIPFLKLFRLQKYKKFESNSQRLWLTYYAFRMNAKTFKDARSAVEA